MKDLEHYLLGKHPRIGFVRRANPDAIRAAIRHVGNGFILPVLISHKKEVSWHMKELGVDISGVEIVNTENFANKTEIVSCMLMIHRGDWTGEAREDKLKDINYFSTMYPELGYIDGLVGGAIATTAETMRPVLRLIRTVEDRRTVSSCVLLERDSIHYITGDYTLSVDPPIQELVEITPQHARTARQFGIEPKVGILSYSSFESGGGGSTDKVRVAVEHLKRMPLDLTVGGEIQMDVAISPVVAKVKAPRLAIAGEMNTLILPNIDVGNISYKIVVELGGFTIFGPILQGLHRLVNISTHRASADTICSIDVVTGVQAVENRS